ncbi:MAG: carboxymuconolactone decarboxylase family protein [Bacteroidetes bacterium]|nr:carboxymuconolactone decarboxylase family protein [Bacteroidota bacterium]
MENEHLVSSAFALFMKEAPAHQQAWMEMVMKLSKASALEPKTSDLAYLAVLAATGLESGIPFHAQMAKSHGATREEVISAILIGLPAAGNKVIHGLPGALKCFEEGD